MKIRLPWPPSVNQYWRSFQGRAILSAKGRQYRVQVAEQVMLQRVPKNLSGNLVMQVEAFRPDKRRRDLDNLLKGVLDGLAHAGVYEDDSQIVDLRIFWAGEGGYLEITVEKSDDRSGKSD